MPVHPEPWRALAKEIRAIKEQLRRQRNASPFTGSGMAVTGSITQKGSVTIADGGVLLVDGGDVVMRNAAGVEVFRIGLQPQGDRGLTISREDGSIAIQVRKLFAPTDPEQVFQILDRDGNVIAGDAGLSGAGFDAPHIPLTFIPTNYDSSTNAQTTSSGTFVATHEHRGFKQNPFFRPQFMVKCSDGTTAGEIRVYDVTGAGYLIGFFGDIRTCVIPTGTTTYTLFELNYDATAGAGPYREVGIPGAMSAAIHLEFHVRRTAGAGSITVAPVRTVAGQVNV
jgi:hypothetical protein